MQITPISYNYNKSTSFGSEEQQNPPKNLKKKVFLTTLAAVGITTAVIAKKQGFSLSLKKILKTNPKDWAIFKFYNSKKTNEKFIKFEGPEIIALGTASVAGGLAGGAVFDNKNNLKAKARESLNQILGNVLIPIGAVSIAGKYYSKNEYAKLGGIRLKDYVEKTVPQIKSTNWAARWANSAIKGIPTIAVTAVALGVGIIAGNRVSNFINEKIYNKKVDRSVKASDFAPHLDDVCYAASLMAPKMPFFSAVSRAVPLALTVPGMETGLAAEEN